MLLVSLSADPDPYPGETIEPEIRARVSSLTALARGYEIRQRQLPSSFPPPDSYDVAIAALFVRVADRKGDIAFPADQRALVTQMFAAGKPVVVAAFGSPYLIRAFPRRADVARRIFDERRFAARRRSRDVRASRNSGANSGHRSRNRQTRRRHSAARHRDDAATRSIRDGWTG